MDLTKNNSDSLSPTQTATRKIAPTRRSVSGIHMFRGATAIPYESRLERDFLLRKEFSLAVSEVIPQPVQIPFTAPNGQTFTYTPDFLVHYRLADYPVGQGPQPLLVEVKPEKEWRKHWRSWLPKWKAAYRYARGEGMVFHVFDESRIRDQTLENIQFLKRYKRMQFPPEESRSVLETVAEMGMATLDDILVRHFMGIYRAEGIAHVWHLLATRQLDCEIAHPLTPSTEFWVPANE